MRRFDLMVEYSTVISPALAPQPGLLWGVGTAPQHVRPPATTTAGSTRREFLRPAASMVIGIALIAGLSL